MTKEETTPPEKVAAETPPGSPPPRQIWANRFRHFLLGVAAICIAAIAYLVQSQSVSSPIDQVTVSTLTPTATPTNSPTPTPTATPRPPTETPTPGPTLTPLPPFKHRVQEGDTWLGLAIWYDVSLDSVLTLNGRLEDDYIKTDEEILIPWPTYTPTPAATQLPTLEVIEEFGPELCRDHTIATGETLISIAVKYDVSVQLIQSVNNITDPDLVKEGQRLCIPLVTPGPAPSPTFGPTPTPAEKPPHPAPSLLYPPAGVEVPTGSREVALQWTVVGFLDPDETYMVEIRNLSRPDNRARRGFVRTTTWLVPEAASPAAGAIETLAGRVGVVRGQGEPGSDGFKWERSGLPSGWQTFLWMGMAPVSTPLPTP